MNPIRTLKKALVLLFNVKNVLEAYSLRPQLEAKIQKLEAKIQNQSVILADNNLKRSFFLTHGEAELLTSKIQIMNLFQGLKVIDTNFELIRVGSKHDGGYLVPNDLHNVKSLFSPGVDKICEFELEFASRGVACYLADASVLDTPIRNSNFHFVKKFVHQGPDEGDFMNFDNWVLNNTESYGDAALQMDIEGYEWEVILGMSERVMRNFRFMVIEFHGMHQLAYQLPFQTIQAAFTKIIQNFDIVHVHANNAESQQRVHDFEVPPLVEITFIRKDLISRTSPKNELSHPLDSDNVPMYPEVPNGDLWNFSLGSQV